MATRTLIAILTFQFFCFVFLQQITCFNNETDLLSLLAIKSVIEFDPHSAMRSWNETTHFCSWNGVRCARNHDRVVGIELVSQGLVGPLSPHLGNLSFLKTINLASNRFHSRIPQEIGLLRRLEVVILDNNSFTGAIPTNLSQCSHLSVLSLTINKLSGVIPTELGSLSELRSLLLGQNTLSGPIPPSIGNLTSLEKISLISCGLNGEIPGSLVRLQSLKLLQLGNNSLTGTIPSALFNISTLQFFRAAMNQLSGVLPSNLGITLPHLEVLLLWRNNLIGQIPLSITNASLLTDIDLSTNSLTGPIPRVSSLTRLITFMFGVNNLVDDVSFISSLINSTELKQVSVPNNMLSGTLPDSIANLSPRLKYLYLDHNMIHGSIPSGIGNLVGLIYVFVHNNDLDGPIPTSIGRLSALNTFGAMFNGLTGALPSSFGNLTSLSILYLDYNRFSGNLPKSLGNLIKLNEVDLSHNNFGGLIPPQIMSLSSVSISFNLSHNDFHGPIPHEVGLLVNLEMLDLSNNRLSGLIPNSLGKCTRLQHIYLEENLLEGDIPSGMSGLVSLLEMDLSSNNLSGPIPDFMGELKLKRLNLSFNRLQGEVPTIGVFQNNTWISIDGNQLCGGIPELKLPPCFIVKSRKKTLLIKILIPTSAAGGIGLIMLLAFITCKRRMSRKKIDTYATSFTGVQILRLSYADLIKATGDFHEANFLGAGRFGSVYKGTLENDQTQVAVKVLNLYVRGSSKSFYAECNSLRNVRHRNILKILSACESIDFQENEFKALVYEFKANGSLDKWLYNNMGEEEEQNAETKNLDLIQRLNIAIDIAQALEYLHHGTDSTIVHGDLKPSNILLDHDMIAYVGDFGLAKIISNMDPSHESTSSGIGGTVGYLAPEYATNNLISTQGDIYSYGIILLEIFTNRRPTDHQEFEDHVDLHSFVCNALEDRIQEVVDPSILIGHYDNPKVKDFMTGILRIGVNCSKTLQRDRMLIVDVVRELRKIREYYLS